jgi:CheY-like chemotaxis protein
MNQKAAIWMIERMGSRVTLAENGKEAVEILKIQSFDLVLMDLQMPEMDGLSATREIRKLGTPVSGIPIIAMTANALKGDRERCLEAGMDDYISKPVDKDGLKHILMKWGHSNVLEPMPKLSELSGEVKSQDMSTALNWRDAMDKFGFDITEYVKLVKGYMNELADKETKIFHALNCGDVEGIAKIAHSLKSSSAYIGASRLMNVAVQLESSARQNERSVGQLCERLKTEIEILRKEEEKINWDHETGQS